MSPTALHTTLNISETVRDRGLVPQKNHQQEMAYGVSNGRSNWKVKLVTKIRLERNIWKTAGDRDSVPKNHQWEMTYGVSNDQLTDQGHVTHKCAVRQYGRLS